MREYAEANREAVNLDRRLRKRGITKSDFDALWAKQQGACAICASTDRKLDIDHCHASKAVRGLLCGPCNRGIGFLEDDVNLLKAAIAYLTKGA